MRKISFSILTIATLIQGFHGYYPGYGQLNNNYWSSLNPYTSNILPNQNQNNDAIIQMIRQYAPYQRNDEFGNKIMFQGYNGEQVIYKPSQNQKDDAIIQMIRQYAPYQRSDEAGNKIMFQGYNGEQVLYKAPKNQMIPSFPQMMPLSNYHKQMSALYQGGEEMFRQISSMMPPSNDYKQMPTLYQGGEEMLVQPTYYKQLPSLHQRKEQRKPTVTLFIRSLVRSSKPSLNKGDFSGGPILTIRSTNSDELSPSLVSSILTQDTSAQTEDGASKEEPLQIEIQGSSTLAKGKGLNSSASKEEPARIQSSSAISEENASNILPPDFSPTLLGSPESDEPGFNPYDSPAYKLIVSDAYENTKHLPDMNQLMFRYLDAYSPYHFLQDIKSGPFESLERGVEKNTMISKNSELSSQD